MFDFLFTLLAMVSANYIKMTKIYINYTDNSGCFIVVTITVLTLLAETMAAIVNVLKG